MNGKTRSWKHCLPIPILPSTASYAALVLCGTVGASAWLTPQCVRRVGPVSGRFFMRKGRKIELRRRRMNLLHGTG